jgi:hypothetical protein
MTLARPFSTGVFLGLWLDSHDGDNKLGPGGFDGFYTYFASEEHFGSRFLDINIISHAACHPDKYTT